MRNISCTGTIFWRFIIAIPIVLPFALFYWISGQNFYSFRFQYQNWNSELAEHICFKPACIHAASKILHSLSPNHQVIDPCTDFEELVCGGWRERHDIPSGDDMVDEVGLLYGRTRKILRRVLEADNPITSEVSSNLSLHVDLHS